LYKIQQIKKASVSLWSGGAINQINTQADAWAYNQSDDTLDVLDILREQSLSISVVRPEEDWVGCTAWLYDQYGRPLFNGGNYDNPVNQNGTWVLPEELMWVNMYPWYQTWIYAPGVISARAVVRDEDGNIIRSEDLYVVDGEIRFLDEYVNMNADLGVTSWVDGQYETVRVSLRGDESAPVEEIYTSIGPSLSIDGLWNYGNTLDYTDYISVQLWANNEGHGQSPVLRFDVSSAKSFYLFTSTTDGQKPIGLTVTDGTTGAKTYYDNSAGQDFIQVLLPSSGFWYVTYEWATFDNVEADDYYWYGDGE